MVRQLSVATPHLAQLTSPARRLTLVSQGATHSTPLDADRLKYGHQNSQSR